jgi:hypothetical protein
MVVRRSVMDEFLLDVVLLNGCGGKRLRLVKVSG